jgi:hypothetical protein
MRVRSFGARAHNLSNLINEIGLLYALIKDFLAFNKEQIFYGMALLHHKKSALYQIKSSTPFPVKN